MVSLRYFHKHFALSKIIYQISWIFSNKHRIYLHMFNWGYYFMLFLIKQNAGDDKNYDSNSVTVILFKLEKERNVTWRILTLPLDAARWVAWMEFVMTLWISAPLASNSRTTNSRPLSEAAINAVCWVI